MHCVKYDFESEIKPLVNIWWITDGLTIAVDKMHLPLYKSTFYEHLFFVPIFAGGTFDKQHTEINYRSFPYLMHTLNKVFINI